MRCEGVGRIVKKVKGVWIVVESSIARRFEEDCLSRGGEEENENGGWCGVGSRVMWRNVDV